MQHFIKFPNIRRVPDNLPKRVFILVTILFFPLILSGQEVPTYKITNLPLSIDVRHGSTESFYVTDSLDGQSPKEIQIKSTLEEVISFDTTTYLFSYLGSDQFRNEFEVEFEAIYNDTIVSKTVLFRPKLPRGAENSFLGTIKDYIPNGSSPEHYLIVEDNKQFERFNYIERLTKRVKVSGGTIVIEPGRQIMNYNDNENISEFIIEADSIVIRQMFHLPQTNVTLKARVILFDDFTDTSTAGINTTPRSLDYRASNAGIESPEGANGEHGLNAGNIDVFSQSIVFPENDDKIRFIAQGGNGQAAGLGIDGANGNSMTDHGNSQTSHGIDYKRVFYIRTYRVWRLGWETRTERYGSKSWPGNGQDAIVAGVPGNPGNGGTIKSNHPIESKCNISGGFQGLQGEDTKGGLAGSPRYAYWYENYRTEPLRLTFHESLDGQDAIAPQAEIEEGQSGQFVLGENNFEWLTSIEARKALVLGKEAFLNSNPQYTYDNYSEYLHAIKDYQYSEHWDSLPIVEQTALNAISSEMRIILLNIKNNQDYFGNVYGYAPYLSFEFYLQNYQREVDRSMRMMYLIYLFENQTSSLEEKFEALNLLREEKMIELVSLKEDYTRNNDKIPPLALDYAGTLRVLDSLQVEQKRVEEELLILAKRSIKDKNKFNKIKRVAGLAGKVASFIPGLQSVGVVLNTVSKFDFEDPFSIENGLSILDGYSAIKDAGDEYDRAIPEAAKATENAINAVINADIGDYIRYDNYRDSVNRYIGNAKNSITPLISTYESIANAYKGLKVSNTEIAVALAGLKAESPEFTQVINKIAYTLEYRQGVLDDHNKIRSLQLKSQSDILNTLLSIDMLNNSISDSTHAINQTLVSYVSDMKQRAQENLLKYHYLMARAYEYRLLKEYPLRLDIESLYSQMQQHLEEGVGGDLSYDNYMSLRALFDDQISQIISDIVDNYEFDRKEAKVSFRLSKEQLAEFNSTGTVTVNPYESGVIFDHAEDVRLIDISVARAKYNTTNNDFTHLATKISVQHSGISVLVKNGKPLLFRNVSAFKPRPHQWKSIIDALLERIETERPSPLDESLLNAMLESGGHGNTNVLLFSAPAANSKLLITRTDNFSSGADLNLTELVFSISYDYVDQPENESRIVIQSNVGMPEIYSDIKDKNERTSGYAPITRYFDKSYYQSVEFDAIENYGEYRFTHWSDRAGNRIDEFQQEGTKIRVPLYENQYIKANYVLFRSELDLKYDTIHVSGSAGSIIQFIEPVGVNPDLNWELEMFPDWISTNQDISGVGSSEINFDYTDNPLDAQRIGLITFMNTEVIGDIDSMYVVQNVIPNKIEQVIDFQQLPELIYGDPAFNISAIGGDSGNEIRYTSSNEEVAMVSGSTIKIVGAGSVVITASQAGNVSYKSAEDVSQTLKVKPSVLKAVVRDVQRVYGEDNPDFEIDYYGFVGSDNVKDISAPTVSTEATIASDVGDYELTLEGGSSINYVLSKTDGILKINRSSLSINAENLSRLYGEDNPELILKVSGFKNSDNLSDITLPTISTTAISTSKVGAYPIILDGGTSKNYGLVKVDGTLTVKKAPLKISPKETSKSYGQANPKFELLFEGFKLDDNESVITLPKITTQANQFSHAGLYNLELEGGSSDNYDLIFQTGFMTITKASVHIRPQDQIRAYGENNESFVLEYAGFLNGDDPTDIISPVPTSVADIESGVGTYSITLSGGVATNYDLNLENGAITIRPAELIAIPDNKSRIYGQDNPELTISYTGFKLNDDVQSISAPVASTEATKESTTGDYAIVLTGGKADNYSLDLHKGSLTIEKAKLIAKPEDTSVQYGLDIPSINITYEGFLMGDDLSSITQPTPYVNATRGSHVGNYTIMLRDGNADNYSISKLQGVLTITKASITISAVNYTRLRGHQNPPFEVIVSGLFDGDDVEDIDVLPTVSTNATPDSPRGQYAIELSGGNDANYEMNLVSGLLSIVAPEVSIPSEVEFLETALGLEAKQNLSLLNSGDAELTVTDISSPEGFSTTLSSFTIQPSQTVNLQINFNPLEAKKYTGSISLATNDGEKIISVIGQGSIITGIDEEPNSLSNSSVYPNPTQNELNVDLTEFKGSKFEVVLLNLSGIEFYRIENFKSEILTIDVSKIPEGVYLLTINNGESTANHKIIIKR